MGRKRSAEELTAEELRRLLIEKKRQERQARLDKFRRTGRMVIFEPKPGKAGMPAAAQAEAIPRRLTRAERRHQQEKRILDRFLLIVEIAAILGLLFVLFNGYSLLQDLNHEVAAALIQPTLTPTPLIMAVVLPSGHTPPDRPGGAQPNEAEIPEHLRPVMQNLSNLPSPTPSPEQAVRVRIEAINIDAPVVQGDGWEDLKGGVGQHVGTADPGQKGNMVFSAHNDVFGELFKNLDQLKEGDRVIVYTNQHQYVYVITGWEIVSPTQVDVMDGTQQSTLTLISCYPYLVDTQRIVVKAVLQNND